MTCKVEGKDGYTRYANNPSMLPLEADFIIEDSFEIISHRKNLEVDEQ